MSKTVALHDSACSLNTFLKCYQSQQVVRSGVRLCARVLEKGGLAAVTEGLRQPPMRLQQALLNIFNLVFDTLCDLQMQPM
jgi:hypothetical protein